MDEKKFITFTSSDASYFEKGLAELVGYGYKIISSGRSQYHDERLGITWWALLERRKNDKL